MTSPTPSQREQIEQAPEKLHILQHSLGVGDFGDKRSYRNHFVTGPGTTDYDNCMALVAEGLMMRTPGSAISGGDDIFRVTPAGVDYVATNSPARPKLTRSAKRYDDYLEADSSLSFREWMGFGRRRAALSATQPQGDKHAS